jgi:nuclear pore complex protein Nup205
MRVQLKALETAGNRPMEQVQAEFHTLMEHFLLQNEANALLFARAHFTTAWMQIIGVTFGNLFHQIPVPMREAVLINTIESVLAKLQDDGLHATDRDALSEVTLAASARLRQDRLILEVARNARGSLDSWTFPSARLLQYFEALIRCIVMKDSSMQSRGNLYAAMLNLLEFVHPSEFERQYLRHVQRNRDRGANGSFDVLSMISTATSLDETDISAPPRNSKERQQLLNGFASVVVSNADKFLLAVCDDIAAETNNVWKTVAFMMLESLTLLSRIAQSGSTLNGQRTHTTCDSVTQYLRQHNILRQLIQELSTMDDRQLVEVLSGTPQGRTWNVESTRAM